MANRRFFMPRECLFGYGCSAEIADFLKVKGIKNVLIVTDKFLNKNGIVSLVVDNFKDKGIDYIIFQDVCPNPTLEDVKLGVEVYKNNKCEGIVAIGGGSPLDCAKAMGVYITGGGELEDYIGVEKCKKDSVPLIAVNTTAGTASEISRACLIIDKKQNRKIAIKDKHCLPALAVNDSMLMTSLPPKLTASTGMDALTHAIESYTSVAAYPVTKCFALEAINLIFNNLEKACLFPKEIEYRDNMIYAEFLAGMSFCNSGLGLVHAMSHQLSSTYGLPHGISNAALLPFVMEFNVSGKCDLYDELYIKLNYDSKGKCGGDESPSERFIEDVKKLSQSINTYVSLNELGAIKKNFPYMADKALADGCYPFTPVKASKKEIIEVYNKAF